MNTNSLTHCNFYFTSFFGSIWNRGSKNWKIPKKKETITLWCGLIRKEKSISKVSKFSILPYTQNRKLWNLGKFSFTSIFCSIWNSKSKNSKKWSKRKNFNFIMWFEKKNTHFRNFRVFDFALYLKSKTWI